MSRAGALQHLGLHLAPDFVFGPGLDEEVSRLKDAGVSFVGDISDHPWGRIASLKDSEGSYLQLYEPPSD